MAEEDAKRALLAAPEGGQSPRPLRVLASAPDPRVRTLAVGGEIDAYTAPALREAVAAALESDGVGGLVVDLSRATFLDSSALGALVGALRRMKERGGGIAIVAPPADVRRIFEITGLDRVLPLHETVAAAVAAVRPAS